MNGLNEETAIKVTEVFACAAVDPTQWLPAMNLMSDAVGAVCSALELTDLNTGEAYMDCSVQLESDVLREYEERVFHINPRVRRGLELIVGDVADDRFLMDSEHPDTPEFLDWLGKTQTFYMQGGKILHSSGHIGFVTSHYDKKSGPPDFLMENFHRTIFPQLINSYEVGRALSDHKLRNELVTQHDLDGGKLFALIDKNGGLMECSSGFAALLRSSNLLGYRGRRLIAKQYPQRAMLEKFLAKSTSEHRFLEPPSPIRLVGTENIKGLVLRSVPLPPRQNMFDIFRPAAIITLVDLDQPTKARRRELIALFGLTGREADVAALIGEGNNIERVAQSLGISQYTVKQHLKVIFSKVGIERQSDLVAIIARLS